MRLPCVFVVAVALQSAAAPVMAQEAAPASQPLPAPAPKVVPLVPIAASAPAKHAAAAAPAMPFKHAEHACTKPPVQVSPYGLLVTNFFFTFDPVNSVEVPTLVSATKPDESPSRGHSFGATVRQSRVGLLAKSTMLADLLRATAVEATFEMDFYGAYLPASNLSYYMPLPRLRLFNATLTFGGFKVAFGQDWSIFAPLNPDSLARVAVTAFSSAGNLWIRLPQLRAEYRAGPFGATVGVLAPADASSGSSDAITNTRVANPADQTSVPSFEGRLFVVTKLLGEAVSAGFSGHYGRENLPDGLGGPKSLPIWGAALDVHLPLGRMFALKAEGFYGANLDGFFSNAKIMGNGTSAEGSDRKAVRAKGGWVQASFKPCKFALHVAAGADDPEPAQSGWYFKANDIDSNKAIYLAATYSFAPKFTIGLAYDWLRTKRVGVADAVTANYLNLAMQFGF